MKRVLLSLIYLLSTTLFASTQSGADLIKQFDDSRYYPQQQGLRDLVVALEVDGLAKRLSDAKSFGDISKLQFKFVWDQNKKWITGIVVGMPEGFVQRKEQLKVQMIPFLEWIIPTPMVVALEQFQFSKSVEGTQTVVTGKQKSGSVASEVKYIFDQSGALKSYSMGSSIYELELKKLPWSKNKLVVTKVTVKDSNPKVTGSVETSINYQTVGVWGFPSEIIVTAINEKTKERVSRVSVGELEPNRPKRVDAQ